MGHLTKRFPGVIFFFVLAAIPCLAAVQRSPAIGSDASEVCDRTGGQPCVFTVTCASALCTESEQTNLSNTGINASLQYILNNEAQRGDTIKIQAGAIFARTIYPAITIGTIPGSSGYLLITTTEAGRLPQEGARITPSYLPLMPVFETQTPSRSALALKGDPYAGPGTGTGPANYIKLRGLAFRIKEGATGSFSRGPLQIGNHSDFSHTVTSDSVQPDNVIVSQCYVFLYGLETASRLVVLHGRTTTFQDNFIDRGQFVGADAQGIGGWNGTGPYTFRNNYIEATGENIMIGGAVPSYDVPGADMLVEFNYLPHTPEKFRWMYWRAGEWHHKGRIIKPPLGSGVSYSYVATTSGYSGQTEPVWPVNNSCAPSPSCKEVTDGGVVWRLAFSGTVFTYTMKNNFELKSSGHSTIRYNVLAYNWSAAQQTLMNIKVSNQSTSGGDCPPYFTGYVDTNGLVVTARPGSVLPDILSAYSDSGDPLNVLNGFPITINGVRHTIFSFDSDTQVTLSTNAGVQSNVPYTYGLVGCYAAYRKSTIIESNIFRHATQAITMNAGNNSLKSRQGPFILRNNLAYDIDTSLAGWGMPGSNAATAPALIGVMRTGSQITNNTFISNGSHIYGMQFEKSPFTSIDEFSGDTKFLNNIFVRGSSVGIRGAGNDGIGLTRICQPSVVGSPCPAAYFNSNIIVGVNRSTYPNFAQTTFNLCASRNNTTATASCALNLDFDDSGNGPDGRRYGVLFENASGRNYRIRTPSQGSKHYAKNGTAETRDIGVDYSLLPEIRNLRVDAAGGLALFQYSLTAVNEQIPCVLEVSVDRDYSTTIDDLNPVLYPAPNTDRSDLSYVDGRRRMILVGSRSPLQPNQTYWYRLHCGGDLKTGSFTTKSSASQPRVIKISKAGRPGVAEVVAEYANTYSRAAEQLTNALITQPVASTQGAEYQIDIPGATGTVVYYRILERNASGQTIHTGPVIAEVIQ